MKSMIPNVVGITGMRPNRNQTEQVRPSQVASVIRYGALHATITSGRVRLATVGGAKIAR